MDPRPPFRIKLPRSLKSETHAPLENGRSDTSVNDATMVDACVEKEKLTVEAYIPADPGPYPQDQPKQNSVRFTPTQVSANSFYLLECNLICYVLVSIIDNWCGEVCIPITNVLIICGLLAARNIYANTTLVI